MPLYIAKSGDLEGCHACLTDWLIHSQTKDSATQLLTKYKSGALVTQFIKQQRNPFINFDKLTRQWLDLGPIKKRVQFVGEIFDPEKELCKQPWWSFAAFPRPLCLCRSPPGVQSALGQMAELTLSPRFHLVTSTAHSKQHSTHLPNKRQNWRHMCWWLEWNFYWRLYLHWDWDCQWHCLSWVFNILIFTSLWGRGSICNSYSFLVIFSFWSEGKTDQSSDMTEVITLSLHSCHI